MGQLRKSFCRVCSAYCPIEIEFKGGTPVRITGDRSAPLYGGYTCAKGRALPAIHNNPNRLLHSYKRGADGAHQLIDSGVAISEISEKLSEIVRRHGPRSVAIYAGQPVVAYPATTGMILAFLEALGSEMLFSSSTIDQPGLLVANALHGAWDGGRPRIDDCDALLFVGANPVVSKQYLSQNPAKKLKDSVTGGAKMIVIDPRATESARRANVHLQNRPGEDATVLAGLIHLLIERGALHTRFIAENVDGLDALSRSVSSFNPEYVSQRAGVSVDKLIAAADILAKSRMTYVGGGTGIGMSGHGNLCFYLLLCIQSLRGFWPAEGARANDSAVLHSKREVRAQPVGPAAATFPDKMRTRELAKSIAGWPSSALPDEILTPGDGQIRALICWANPVMTMPETEKVAKAFADLELLVTPNIEWSETGRASHYVIATKNVFETPASTHFMEGAKAVHPGYGWEAPYAQYTPALLDCPPGADLLEDATILYRIAQKMGLQLKLPNGVELDMKNEPSTNELFEFMCINSVVPLSSVRAHDGARLYEDAQVYVGERDNDCMARLNVADRTMMDELRAVLDEDSDPSLDGEFAFRLTCRRTDGVMGSSSRNTPGAIKNLVNPGFMHSNDLKKLGIAAGQYIIVRSRFGELEAVAAIDDGLRPGVLSMTHGFGAVSKRLEEPEKSGANVNRLLRMDIGYDAITGMPRMSAIPVSVSAS